MSSQAPYFRLLTYHIYQRNIYYVSSFRARRTLFSNKAPPKLSKERQKRQWLVEEKRALVAYICLYSAESTLDDWPTARNPSFRNACAAAFAETKGYPKRSGKYIALNFVYQVLKTGINSYDNFLEVVAFMNIHVIPYCYLHECNITCSLLVL